MSLTSPLKSIIHPATGRMVHMGSRRPVAIPDRRVHRMAGDLFRGSLPRRPSRTDYGAKAQRVLGQILMNDQLSCCTVSGMYHIAGVTLGNADAPITVSNGQVESVYQRTGWVPGEPSTDQGWDEVSALDSWMTVGIPITVNGVTRTHRIAGWLSADPNDVEQMKNLIWLFENLYFGWEMPDAWVNAAMPSASGFTWDVAGDPDPSNGHCTIAFDSADSDRGPNFDTWGLRGIVTWDAIAKYSASSANGEVHCIITADSLLRASQKAPTGFDWAQCVSYFDQLGGHIGAARSLLA